MAHTINTGDCFEPGQVWMTSRGTLWAVIGYAARPGKRKQAVLRMGTHGKGRKRERDWDAVDQWVIYTHKDGTPSAMVLAATLAERKARRPPVRVERASLKVGLSGLAASVNPSLTRKPYSKGFGG